MQHLCSDKELAQRSIKITFVCKKNQDIKKNLDLQQGKSCINEQTKRKWWTMINNSKCYYTEIGNRKIEDALTRNLK